MIETLIKIGLSDKEAKVYLASLELGRDSVQNIAMKARVNRATTYVILEKLLKLGLVSCYEEGKKTVYSAGDPHELTNILEAEKRQIDAKKEYLHTSLNELLAIYNARGDKPTVRYFEGADGLQALDRFKEGLKPNSELMSFAPIDIIEDQFPDRRKLAVSERVKLGIKSRMIYTHKNGPIANFSNPDELREAVFLPRENFPFTTTIAIHNDWGVKIYNFNQQQAYGILILSPELASNMKLVFDLAWQTAKAYSQIIETGEANC